MMAGLNARYPNVMTLLMAAALAFVVYLVRVPEGDPAFVVPRMLFAAALVCLWLDSLAAARILAPVRDLTNPDRWVLAGHNAWYFCGFLFIATWQDLSDPVPPAIGAGMGGVLFGAIMAFVFKGQDESAASKERFDLSRPITGFRTGQAFSRIWPLLMAAGLAGLLAYPPDGGWAPQYLCFLIVLSPSVMVAYPAASGLGLWRSAWAPRIIGTLLVLAGLFLPV